MVRAVVEGGVTEARTTAEAGAGAAAPTRVERRKARTVRSILDAAERLFVQRGYDHARIEDIAETADVSVGSIYVHFGNKAGLYLAVVERALSLEESYLDTAYAEGLPPTEQLTRVGDAYLRFYFDHPGWFRLLSFPPPETRRTQPSPTAVRLQERAVRLIDRLAGVIAAGVASGEARPVHPGRAARFLWGAWTGVIALHLRPDRLGLSDAELEAVLAEGRGIVADGLVAQSSTPPEKG